jgi:N-acetyl-D-muramate 6-phosphate phosphatase
MMSSIPLFEGVFFDLDGTLADTAPDLVAAANRLLISKNMPPMPYESLRPMASAGARGLIHKSFGIDKEHPDFISLRDEFLNYYEEALLVHSKLYEGMEELLQKLEDEKLPWGIVTNKQKRFTVPLTEQMGLMQRAHCIVSGDTTAFSKPHPEPILHAARLTKVDPQRALYVGDDIRDIVSGKAAGMQTAAALYGYCGCNEPPSTWGANYQIQHPRELQQIIFAK